jgi:tetratricopeptide (TPR) repeat protein
VLLDLGDATGARATLAPAPAEVPDDPRAQLLLDEIEAATSARAPSAPPICTGERWRPSPINAACLLARAAAERRAGRRNEARTDAETAAGAAPDEPRLLARIALVLAQLGAVDRAAALVVRGRRLAAPELPALSWASAAVVLGRGRAGALPAGPRPADPETDLLVARTALAAGGVGALGRALRALGPPALARDADLARFERLTSRGPRRAPPAGDDDPLQAYLDGLAAQLDGDLARATDRFARALSGHGDACRAAGEYVAAMRAQKRRPDPAVFTRLRADSSHCADLR